MVSSNVRDLTPQDEAAALLPRLMPEQGLADASAAFS
jgi:hypothetical protein